MKGHSNGHVNLGTNRGARASLPKGVCPGKPTEHGGLRAAHTLRGITDIVSERHLQQ